MKVKMKFLTKINDKNEIEHTPTIRHRLSKFDKKKEVMVEVKKPFNKRSLDQNALMWVWFTIIADFTGYAPEEVHHVVKGLYCPKKAITLKGKTYRIPKGTSELSVSEMIELMMRIQAMAGEMGIRLPSPEEYKKGLDSAMLLTEDGG